MERKIDIVNSEDGDWMAVYLNGEDVYQGHSIEPDDLLKILDIEANTLWVDLNGADRFPRFFKDIKR